ncbi:MAG: (Fe-S)-binding protein [Caldilineales bacterium]
MSLPTIALFITCVADLYRPETGEATVALLEQHGARVEFPAAQTCCGAHAWQAGWRQEALDLAKRWIGIFEPFALIVAPSPMCVAHVRQEMPRLLAGDADWQRRAEAVAARTLELSEFLHRHADSAAPVATFHGKLVYQPACQHLRTLDSDAEAQALLEQVAGAQRVPLADSEACCGFGGLLPVRQPQIAAAMADRKAHAIETSNADLVVCSEPGCVLHMAEGLKRRDSTCRAVHLAELLAGQINE